MRLLHTLSLLLVLVLAVVATPPVRAVVITPPVIGVGFVQAGSNYSVFATFSPALNTGSSYFGSGYDLVLTTTQANGNSYSETVGLPANTTISSITFPFPIPASDGFTTGDTATVTLLYTDIFGNVSVVASGSAVYGPGSDRANSGNN